MAVGTDSSSRVLYACNLICVAVFIFNRILKDKRLISRLPSTSTYYSIWEPLKSYFLFVSGLSLPHLTLSIPLGREQFSEGFGKHIQIADSSCSKYCFQTLINLSTETIFPNYT